MVTSVGNSAGQSILTALNAGGGIDANNLATSLVNAEKLPQQNIIDAATKAANTTISSVGKVKSSLTTLQTTLTGLGDVKSFQTTAVSSDSSKVTVAFKAGVTPPTFSNSIDVQQVATATTVLMPAVTSQDGSLLGTSGAGRTFSLVSGSVQNSVVNGVAMTLPTTPQTGSITINGKTTATFTLGTTSLSDNRKAIVAAINAISAQSGVAAVDNGDDTKGVTLTAGDGRAISVSFVPAGSVESADVSFKDMVAGSSLTLGGLTFTASTDMTAAQVAAAFANRTDGTVGTNLGPYTSGSVTGSFSGTLTGWSSGSVTGSNVTFNATGQGNVTDLASVATTPAPSISTTQGAASTSENSVVTFGSLAAGSSVTVAGLTLTATTAMTSSQVATAFSSLTNGNAVAANYSNGGASGTFSVASGSLALNGWSTGAATGSAVTFTSSTLGNVTDLTVATNAASPTVSITNGQSATQQTSSVAFNALAAGNSLTIGGLTLLANTAMSATDVAQAFASRADGTIGSNLDPYANNGVSATFSGTLTGWSSGAYSAGNNAILFTATASGAVPNLPVSAASSVPLSSSIQGAASSQETTDITFNSLAAGSSVTIGGLTLTATTAMTSAQVATAFASRTDGVSGNNISPYSDGAVSGIFSGSLNGWSSGTVSGSVVRFTSTASGNVTDLNYSSATGQPDVVKVEPSANINEVSTVTFKPLAAGSSVTVAGLTYTATSPMAASAVAAAFASKTDGYVGTGQYSGTLSGWASGTASGSSVNFTATATGNVTDISQSAAVVSPSVTTTTVGQAATAQTSQVAFNALAAGGSVTIGGLTFTANASLTATQVAAAFASLSTGVTTGSGTANGTYSGTLSGWSSGTVTGSNVTFTSTSFGPVNDLTIASTNSSEINDITFKDLAAGRSVTVGGLTLTASTTMTAAQVASAFASRADGVSGTNLSPYSDGTSSGVFSGSLNGWSSGTVSGAVVRFTSTVAGNVTDLTYATGSAQPDVVKIDGTTGNYEQSSITFKALASGSSVTIAGLTFTAGASALTATQVASAFGSLSSGATTSATGTGLGGTYSGTLTGWSSAAASGTSVNFTSTSAGNLTDITQSTAIVAPTQSTNLGLVATAQTSAVTFNALAAGGSLTIGGLTFTATSSLSSTQVADAFASLSAGMSTGSGLANGTYSGTLSGWSSGSASGNIVTFISNSLGPVNDLSITSTNSTEFNDLTFKDIAAGRSVTVGGLTLTASTNMTAAQVATAFSSRADGVSGSNINPYSDGISSGTFSGSLNGWASGPVSGNVVRFSSTVAGNVSDLTYTTGFDQPDVLKSDGATNIVPTVVITAGIAATSTASTVTFKPLASGDSITLGGLTLTATSAMLATDVATAFANRANGTTGTSLSPYVNGAITGTFSGTLLGWSTGNAAAANLTFTSSSTGPNPAISLTSTAGGLTVTTTQGAAVAENNTLTFKNLNANDTVTIGGLTLTASASLSASEVANAFANLSSGASGTAGTGYTFSGSLTGWTTGSVVSGNKIVATSTSSGNVTDLSLSSTSNALYNISNTKVDGASNTAPTVTKTAGVAATTTASTVAFQPLASGDSVTIGGLTLTATSAMAAADVATAFANRTNGTAGSSISPYVNGAVSATFSGTLQGWSTAAATGSNLVFTASTTGANPAVSLSASSGALTVSTAQGPTSNYEFNTLSFKGLNSGASLTIAGLKFSANADLTAAQVAAAFASMNAGATTGPGVANGSYSGTLTGWSTAAVPSGNTIVFTATTAGNVNDLAISTTPPVSPTATKVDGGQPTNESTTVTFNAMVPGNSVTIGGLTFTASSTMSAAQVATAFSNLADGKSTSSYSNAGATGQFTGTLTGWSSGVSSAATVMFTATNSNNVTDLTLSAASQSPTVTTTQAVSASTENAAVTFKGLTTGSSVTVAGLTLTASTDMSDLQVAAAFASRLNGASGSAIGTYNNSGATGVFTGSLAGWSSSTANGAVINFTAATTGNVPDLTVSTSMPSPVVNTTQGTAATNEQSLINFTALAAGSSLTVAGLTLNATTALSATQVATAFANIAGNGSGNSLAGSYSFSGSLTGWSSAIANNNSVLFTATSTGNAADISITNSASSPSIATNQGATGLTSQLTGINIGNYVTSLAGNSLPGTAMSQPSIMSPATSTTGTIVINDTSISVTLTSDLVANRAAILSAINAQTKTTGVTAVNSGTDAGGISLTSASTKSISVSFPTIIGTSANPTLNPLNSATTGIRDGRVNGVSKSVGGAMTAPSIPKSGDIKINGVTISLSLGINATSNRNTIMAAINAQTGNTGVTASANASDTGITLTAADGRAIKTDLGTAFTEAQTGLKKTVLLSVDIPPSSTETLTTLRDKINAVSGMTATIVQGGTDAAPLYYLSIKSGLGVVNNFYADVTNIGGAVPLDAADTSNSVPATDGLLGDYYSTVTLGQDAKISVDGVSITSSTNTFDKAVPNVIITAVAATNGSPVTVKSETNTTALTNAINSLVSGYNQVISTMTAEMAYNTTDPTKNGGLANSPIARTLVSQLRSFTTQSITGYDGNSHTLADIGVKTNIDGTLTLDNATFTSVLASNPDLVAAVLASKQSVSDSRLAPGAISSTAKTGVYTIKKQIMPPTVTNTAATATSNASASVQFYGLKSGAQITIGGLTFQSNTDMTPEEVAAAFASLSFGATSGPSTSKGTYSGTLSGWSSGLVAGSILKFTSQVSGVVNGLTSSGTSTGWTINGEPAVLSGNTLTAVSTSAAAGISVFIPSDFASAAADGFTATLNYSQGIVERFNNMINAATGTASTLQNLTDDENRILSDLTTKQTNLDNRMAALLTRYQQQFSTLTTLLNKAKSTQSSLTDFQTAWSNSLKGN